MFLFPSTTGGASLDLIQIGGMVRQSLALTIKDLNRFQSSSVRLNEVSSDGTYHGVFHYTGVPLRTILEMAVIEKKKDAGFNKLNDLAIIVKNKAGETSLISWGEVFYRNPGEIILATSASPIVPHVKLNDSYASQKIYAERLAKLSRSIGFPRLVVAGDFYTDRSLEGVESIEVVDLKPPTQAAKRGHVPLFSSSFSIITDDANKNQQLTDLGAFPREDVITISVGDGTGYHGIKTFSGVPLASLLDEMQVDKDPKTAILVTASDGYRSLLSYGELFYSINGKRILMADQSAGAPLKNNGKFILILPDDQAADRLVKAVSTVEILRIK
jgi:hypothetical protein